MKRTAEIRVFVPQSFIYFFFLVFFYCEVCITADSKTFYRLPDKTKPKSYDLKIWANLANEFDFNGEVIIEINVRAPTGQIILNSKDLQVEEVKIYHENDNSTIGARFNYNKEYETLLISPNSDLKENNDYKLYIKFKGKLNNNSIGFYRSYYRVGNHKKWLAVTQFAPSYARMAFPCYDEPHFRTPFNISVARYPYQKTTSNMPHLNISDPDPSINNRVWDTFDTTPPMPTYLVAFVISDLNYVTDAQKKFYVWAREAVIEDGVYIVQEGPHLLKQLETFLGMPYMLPKLDVMAIPDMKFGAMENYGLITCREENLLYKKDISSELNLERLTMTVMHEIAHQWFGDFVSPKWWDFTWLSEAFATYFQYNVTAQIELDWRLNESFVIDVLQEALFVDDTYIHHAMTSVKNTSDDINFQFDDIVYNKGASIIRMLEHIVTPSIFWNALNMYLNKSDAHGGYSTPDDLWDAFDKQANLDKITLPPMTSIKSIMRLWTENRGYPLVTVTRGCNTGNVTVNQKMYTSVRSLETSPNHQWIIPLTYTTKSLIKFDKKKPMLWLFPDDSLTLKTTLQNDEWIIFNLHQTGYYRVNYDQENWSLLIEQLKTEPERIDVINRAQLIDDSFSMAIDGVIPFSTPLKLAMYLDNETDMIPWMAALRKFQHLRVQFESTSVGAQLKDYILERVKKQYNRIGFHPDPNDDHLTKIGRSAVVNMACRLELWDCVENSQKLYVKNVKDLSNVNPDIKETVFCTVLKSLNVVSVWNKLWWLYQKSNVAHEQKAVLMALGCLENQQLLKKYLFKFINSNDTDLRDQYMTSVFSNVFSTRNGVAAGLNLLTDLLRNLSNLNEKTLEKLVAMLTLMKSRIYFEDQVIILEKLILDSQNLDENLYGRVRNALDQAYKQGFLQVEETRKKVEEVEEALYSSTGLPSTPKPSTDSDSTQSHKTTTPKSTPSAASTNYYYYNKFSGFVYVLLLTKLFAIMCTVA